jgi:predicted metal-dependent HD superfamily phosphohydrolase
MGGVEFPVPGSEQLREELLRRWGEPHRHYHDRRHLSEVLAALPDDAPRAVRLAAWYHDAVYDPTRDDNEEASARLAREQLHALVSDKELGEVERLVMLTRTHEPAPDDADGSMLCDADLAILACAPGRYDEYASDVRAEYAHVGDAEFRRGRAAVLRELLAHPRLFGSRPDWEQPARSNLQRELRWLGGPSAGAAPPR